MKNILSLAALLIALVSVVIAFTSMPTTPIAQSKTESAYERVLKTKTIRCAYMLWPQFMERDPNTRTFSGFNYDIMQAIGESLGLKVEWVAEIAYGTQVDTLTSRKADAVCTAEGPLSPVTTLFLGYTEPVGYFPFFLYARADDSRFGEDISTINDAKIRIAVIDGDASGYVAQTYFPLAQQAALPQFGDPAQLMTNVVTNKADILVMDAFTMVQYNANNPGQLRQISSKPIIVVPNTLSVLRTETALQDMLSQATRNLLDRGQIEQIFKKNQLDKNSGLWPVTKSYIPYTTP
jgi:ABC-type amino acid transport substrate-binding protein